jgi:hypothetical protein
VAIAKSFPKRRRETCEAFEVTAGDRGRVWSTEVLDIARIVS